MLKVVKLSAKFGWRKSSRFDPADPEQLERALNEIEAQYRSEGWRVLSVAPLIEVAEGISSLEVLVIFTK